MRATKIDKAIAALEDEIKVLQLAIAKLKAQAPSPRLVKAKPDARDVG